jgi:hypothetical protein
MKIKAEFKASNVRPLCRLSTSANRSLATLSPEDLGELITQLNAVYYRMYDADHHYSCKSEVERRRLNKPAESSKKKELSSVTYVRRALTS